jgi:hypothetical protein
MRQGVAVGQINFRQLRRLAGPLVWGRGPSTIESATHFFDLSYFGLPRCWRRENASTERLIADGGRATRPPRRVGGPQRQIIGGRARALRCGLSPHGCFWQTGPSLACVRRSASSGPSAAIWRSHAISPRRCVGPTHLQTFLGPRVRDTNSARPVRATANACYRLAEVYAARSVSPERRKSQKLRCRYRRVW